ncbi:DUF5937 family protein [Streptomyces sp. NPDC007157]|uniref:ArsR/SmtB family transcription factor n=1 Tax=Streptomyces sp. NPDC007157 TaxID=3154681 RepID=UPI0033DD6020
MIRFSATVDDIARVRFSPSPLGEAVYSIRMLASAERRRRHQPWVDDVRAKLRTLDLLPLRALIPPTGYVPDFLTPPPDGSGPRRITEELEMVRATPSEHFVAEVSWMAADPGTPVTWRQEAASLHRQMLAQPAQAIARITEQLQTYWDLALEPHWRRLHGGLQSDIRSRMQVIESSGAAPVFSSLHPRIAWRDQELTVRSAYDYQKDLGGRGIVLVPSVFCGPEVLTMTPPQQSMIVYPRPGVEELWHRYATDQPSPLAALLGGVRSAVLEALLVPASTGDLAEAINVTPGAISQHVAVLRECDLVTSRRHGRRVIHSLTETGEALVRGAVAPGGGRLSA